jgi:hypothetical protein
MLPKFISAEKYVLPHEEPIQTWYDTETVMYFKIQDAIWQGYANY